MLHMHNRCVFEAIQMPISHHFIFFLAYAISYALMQSQLMIIDALLTKYRNTDHNLLIYTQCIQFRDAWNAHRTSANELKNVHTYGIAHLIISWNHSTNNFIAYAISIKLFELVLL